MNNYDIAEVAARLKATRLYLDIPAEDLAARLSVSPDEYAAIENGHADISLSQLFACSEAFGIELIELLTGSEPRLQKYTIVRADEGLPIQRREGFSYQHLAYLFKHKKIEPLAVTAPGTTKAESAPVHLSSHAGQEWDFILSGRLRFVIGAGAAQKEELLYPGDSVYYDSANPHGMAAVGGDCKFLAVLIAE